MILVGNEEEIEKNKGAYDITGAVIVDPAKNDKTEEYIAKLVELRQKRNDRRAARELLLNNYLYYGVMMVKMGCRRMVSEHVILRRIHFVRVFRF